MKNLFLLSAWSGIALLALIGCASSVPRFESLAGEPPIPAIWLVASDSCLVEDGWISFRSLDADTTQTKPYSLGLHFEQTENGLSAIGLGPFGRVVFEGHWQGDKQYIKQALFSGMPWKPHRLAGDFLLLRQPSDSLARLLGATWRRLQTDSLETWIAPSGRDSLSLGRSHDGLTAWLRRSSVSERWQVEVHSQGPQRMAMSACRELAKP